LITGASSGIGRACAQRLDRLGYRVFAGVRQAGDGEALQAGASDRLTPVHIDVTQPESIAAAQATIAHVVGAGGLFGLVNNAGVAYGAPLEFLPLADLRQQLEVNVVGVVAVTQALLPLLRQARGRIINMGSISGVSAMPFMGAYCATKFALEAISDTLRVELRPWGIAVSIVEPGDIQTPIWHKGLAAADKMLAAWPPDAFAMYGPVVDMMGKSLAAPRGIPAEVVAEAVARLLQARRPAARVLVGNDARLLAVIERLPTRLRDWLVYRQLPSYG
jgi:NAD(P)-dependent dehydrogenase (short-subunit alcohol dehydrogenase family)